MFSPLGMLAERPRPIFYVEFEFEICIGPISVVVRLSPSFVNV